MRKKIETLLYEHWLNPPDLNIERSTELFLCGLIALRTPLKWQRLFDGSIRWSDWKDHTIYPKKRRNHHYKSLSPVNIDQDINNALKLLFQQRKGQPRLKGRGLKGEPIISTPRRTLETCMKQLFKAKGINLTGPSLKTLRDEATPPV